MIKKTLPIINLCLFEKKTIKRDDFSNFTIDLESLI